MIRARRILAAAMLALFLAPCNAADGASMTHPSTDQSRTLLIVGASYAGSWGSPALPGYRVVNRGVGGEQTKDAVARFPRDVTAQKPDVVLIWGHINDITQSPPERVEAVKAATREHYLEMLRQAREAGITVVLATEIPLAESTGLADAIRAYIGRLRGKQSYAERINIQVRELNEFLRRLADSQGLLLLDFERVFAPDGGARKPEFAAEDRSHVTKAGYDAITTYAGARLAQQK